MEWTSTEEKNGYEIWHNSAGEQYIVIDGLDPNQVHSPGTLESFLIENYDFFAIAYWFILTFTFTFLIFHFLIRPLLKRRKEGLPIFSDQ